MRFTAAATVAGLAAVVTASPPAYGYGYGAPAMNTTISSAPAYTTPAAYVTEVVTEYTTYCPGPTQITYGTHTYTVTEATTLTITDCPCTVTKPVYSSVYTTSDCTTATPAPTYPVSSPAPPPYQPPANGTAPPAYQPPATGSYTPPAQTAPPAYTGAASKASFGVAGLLAVVGAVAAL